MDLPSLFYFYHIYLYLYGTTLESLFRLGTRSILVHLTYLPQLGPFPL